MTKPTVDYLIVGGGFYGCALALFLRSISHKVSLVEADNELLGRASRVNQARVHTGFHYPRSALTAVKSVVLHSRFAADFPDAIVDDFQMLYGISRRRSKVSAQRFYRMFSGMDAPIAKASPSQAALFDPELIEQSFACHEFAFDYSMLRKHMASRLDALGIHTKLGTRVVNLSEAEEAVTVQLSDGSEVRARYVFNVTYAQINHLLANSNLPLAAVKHELAELALVEVPPELSSIGITIMDGAFMSCMPYPPAQLHSLTHVRYTPHCSWTDEGAKQPAYDVFDSLEKKSRHRHMLLDGRRYVPALADARWCRSIFAVKTTLIKNECDDGRPILFQRNPIDSRIISILGGKIDNIYDLFEIMRGNEEWSAATTRFVFSTGS